jgi:hypothetical protein
MRKRRLWQVRKLLAKKVRYSNLDRKCTEPFNDSPRRKNDQPPSELLYNGLSGNDPRVVWAVLQAQMHADDLPES